MKVMTSREFNQDVSQAKRAARLAPVFVTDRGKPTHVLLSIEAFRGFSGERASLADLLAMRDDDRDDVPVVIDGAATAWDPRR